MRIDELRALCNKHPISIPIREAAKFLGVSEDGIRAACLQGSCPFAFGWRSAGCVKTAYKLPTLAFFCWLTKGAVPMD